MRFSEKVLFVANYDKLLADSGEDIDRYVLVLQAVGNSIQIQANELDARAAFQNELRFREAPEIWAQEKGAKKCDANCNPQCQAGPCGEGYGEWRSKRSPPIRSAAEPGNRSQQQVLDDMIAALRYEHIQAVKAAGSDSDTAKYLARALAVAYEQRAGMAYIRPSSAYLRSSYPATSLQDDPRLGWRNMLSEHALRGTPFIGESLTKGDATARQRDKITAEIDKQFWQNINSVRVAGAGTTNYVIAKDDVGNWYVKSYAANPEPIIKSAKSLAMFGIGQGFDPDLMGKALKDRKDGDGGTTDDAAADRRPPPSPALGPVFRRKTEMYSEATDADFQSARDLLLEREKSSMALSIEEAWMKHPDTTMFQSELESAMDIAFTEASRQSTPVLGVPKGVDEPGPRAKARRILTALGEIRRFHKTLSTEIETLALKNHADTEVALEEAREAKLRKELGELERQLEEAERAASTGQPAAGGDQPAAEGGGTAPAPAPAAENTAAARVEELKDQVSAKEKEIADTGTSVQKKKERAARAEAAETAALREVGRVVNGTASRLIERRLKAVADYEAAVLFISDANTRPKPGQGN